MTLPDLPDEDTDREMYHLTKEMMAAHGYDRYEISNYAKKGYECRHNIGYWTGVEYLGLGLARPPIPTATVTIIRKTAGVSVFKPVRGRSGRP